MEIPMDTKKRKALLSRLTKVVEKDTIERASKFFMVDSNVIHAEYLREGKTNYPQVNFSCKIDEIDMVLTVETWDAVLYWSNINQGEAERIYKQFELINNSLRNE